MMSLYSLCCLFLSVTTCKLPVSFCLHVSPSTDDTRKAIKLVCCTRLSSHRKFANESRTKTRRWIQRCRSQFLDQRGIDTSVLFVNTTDAQFCCHGPHLPQITTDDTSNWSCLSLVRIGSCRSQFTCDTSEVRYEVTTTSDTQCTVEGVPQNAFDVLMESARQMYLQQNETGNLQVVTERNRQHKLYNDIIKQLTSQGLSFKADEVDTSGTKLVRLLCDILWHIDARFSVKVCSNSYRI